MTMQTEKLKRNCQETFHHRNFNLHGINNVHLCYGDFVKIIYRTSTKSGQQNGVSEA